MLVDDKYVEDWARKIANSLEDFEGNVFLEEIAEKIRQTRANALEEAAQWINLIGQPELANAIRYLKEKQPWAG